MPAREATFKAFVVDKKEDGFIATFKDLTLADLPPGEVLVKVAYSSVNYKDGLASIPEGKIVRNYPFVPGIDLSGVVAESSDPRFKPGDEVIVTSYELGVSHYGGFSEYARVKADWVVPLPSGLTLKEAMALGTAGFTAALAIYKQEYNGLKPLGNEFFTTVFEKLKAGETGTAASGDKSEVYVVKISNRTPSTPEELETFRQTFMVRGLANEYFDLASRDWALHGKNPIDELLRRNNVRFNRPENDRAGS